MPIKFKVVVIFFIFIISFIDLFVILILTCCF
ncbi:hypothetical protein [Staphylococcus phage APTC_SA_12]|nr:MAG: hypothetical protein [Staphylococcus phage RP2]UPO38542.1 hypothetical protein [Staphylococcus phage vB_SaS_GE1]UWV20054.1 hypothetical protein [Staphylococcus phage APTC_SA_2]UWV20485.1 hypothetical protein [Staphylococcus phage APTC_SA_12]UWV20639.1 hypothetical protein [Staphylococcus phage APTC_SA_13]WMT38759.1 hypothetical protein [Staphylococcus phage Sp2021]